MRPPRPRYSLPWTPRGEADDRLDDRQRVPGPMIHLPHQESLALLGALAIGDVDGHAAEADHPPGRIDAGRGSPDAPARLPVRTMDAKLGLEGLSVLAHARERGTQPVPILRMNEGPDVFGRERETAGIDAENAILPFIPGKLPPTASQSQDPSGRRPAPGCAAARSAASASSMISAPRFDPPRGVRARD